jgi:cytidine deaminase
MRKLNDQQRTLLAAARKAAANARAPHSSLHVGAAVQAEDGRIFVGCNVESDSFGLTICAERAAIVNALSAGARALTALAVACPDLQPGSLASRMPCGACRQVMAEYLPPEAPVLVDGAAAFTVSELLPQPFGLPDRG